jgi:hypothetical protein
MVTVRTGPGIMAPERASMNDEPNMVSKVSIGVLIPFIEGNN